MDDKSLRNPHYGIAFNTNSKIGPYVDIRNSTFSFSALLFHVVFFPLSWQLNSRFDMFHFFSLIWIFMNMGRYLKTVTNGYLIVFVTRFTARDKTSEFKLATASRSIPLLTIDIRMNDKNYIVEWMREEQVCCERNLWRPTLSYIWRLHLRRIRIRVRVRVRIRVRVRVDSNDSVVLAQNFIWTCSVNSFHVFSFGFWLFSLFSESKIKKRKERKTVIPSVGVFVRLSHVVFKQRKSPILRSESS